MDKVLIIIIQTNSEFGGTHSGSIYIIEDTLNLKSPTVYKTIIKEDRKLKKQLILRKLK